MSGPAWAPGPEEEGERPEMLVLPARVEEELSGPGPSIGIPGRPLDKRTPFFIGLTAALGVAVAYLLVRSVIDVASILILIGLSLFFAVGLNPILEFLIGRGLTRRLAAAAVVLAFLATIALFLLLAIPPISSQIQHLIANYPHYRAEAISGKGWIGKAVTKLHLTGYLKQRSHLTIPVTQGLLGVGKVALTATAGTVTVVVLTIYFLVALPRVRDLWLGTIPRSRRERVSLLTDEVLTRVGGFMLGNLLTSVVSGVGTWLWLTIFGVPYSILLALLVAFLDLIPLVGSTVGGIIVSLVALTRGLPIAIATLAFYIVYRFLEDYLLNPRVMKHTVKIAPGLTIVATLIGGALLGIIGALLAIPTAATIHLLYDEVVVPRQNDH